MDPGKRRLNTGVAWLDQLLTKYHPGDNVLWCAAAGTHVEEFLRSSLEAAADDDRLIVYLSFERPPMDVRRELGDLSQSPKFTLVDCFTDGDGQSRPELARFYDGDGPDGVRNVLRMRSPADPDRFSVAMHDLARSKGQGTVYVIDSLNAMERLWDRSGALYQFIAHMCPHLYHLWTIAHWVYHVSGDCRPLCDPLASIMQVVLDLSKDADGPALRVVKAESRTQAAQGRPAVHYELSEGRLHRAR